jgi:quercetin dioxygenase-like cupin family protein
MVPFTREGEIMRQQPEQMGLDRRAVLVLGLAGASALVLGTGNSGVAGEATGMDIKVIKEVESMIPGFPKVRLREATYQPGGRSKNTMQNPMVCECSQGSLEVTQDGKTFTAKQGDIWTCDKNTVEENVNKGSTVAVMRVFDLLPG